MAGSSQTLRILLRSLCGGEAEVHVAGDARAHDLKVEVSNLLFMPVAFQVLIANNRPLADTDVLAECDLVNDDTLLVTAILAMDSVARSIPLLNKGTTKQVKLDTLENFAMMGPKCPDDVIPAVGKLLLAWDVDVRHAAWACMTKVAERGNRAAIKSVIEQLKDSSSREAAIEALGKLADVGDSFAISELALYLEHQDVDLCLFALESLGKFAGKGHNMAIVIVARCLCDEEHAIRWKAVEVLQRVVAKGDQKAISHVKALMNHPNRQFRWAATEAFGQFCDP
eukprot:CAMPEP_0117491382 /NCGR_PEP_ID=MMETSP0784-20121206/18037_1 /TAXON_ID=39447 /ORGANISM="" /LENGTH=282 /DNA_ID=CAMNT_0005286169 /DNA_START=118 /DNA_END=966 /DNA_ORIENTATION=-